MPREGCPASPASDLHLAVAAAKVDERGAFACADADDFTDENRVIAAGQLIVDRALQGGQRTGDQRDSQLAAAHFDPRELVVGARGKSRRDVLLVRAEDADPELAGRGD